MVACLSDTDRDLIPPSRGDADLDALIRLAARLFEAGSAALLVFDGHQVWQRAAFGPRWSAATVQSMRVLAEATGGVVVPDLGCDPRFAVAAAAPDSLRFVAARSFAVPGGSFIAMLVIADARARAARPSDGETLASLAQTIEEEVARRDVVPPAPLPSASVVQKDGWLVNLLMRHVPALVWTTDLALRFTSGLGAGLGDLQLPAHQFIGVSLVDYFRPAEGVEHAAIAGHQRALAGEAVVYDFACFGRIFHTRVEPLRDGGGAIIGTVGVGIDVTEGRRHEGALERSEQRLRAILASTQGIVFELDGDCRYQNVWTTREDLLVRPASEMVGRTIAEVVGAAKAAEMVAVVERVLRTGRGETLEYGLEVRSGARWFIADAMPIGGAVPSVALVVRDITDRKAMEEALRATQLRLSHLMTAGPAVIYSSTILNRFQVTYMSERAQELTGFPAQRFVDEPGFWVARIHPDDQEGLLVHVQQTLATGRHAFDYRFLCADGGYRWIRDELCLVRDEEGRPIEVVGHWADISAVQQSIEAARQSEERYRLTVRATNDVIWDWNVITGELSWSESVGSSLGYDASEVERSLTWWEDRIAPEDRLAVMRSLNAVLESAGDSWSHEYRFRRGDGSWADIMDRGSVLRNAEGIPTRMVGAMADVSERNRMRSQMVQSDRLASIGTLAAGVAHEINNPLAYVLGNMEFVRDKVADPVAADNSDRGAILQAIDEARDGARRVQQIVRDLKIFARGDEARQDGVALAKVVDSAIALSFNQLRHAARIEKQFGPTPKVYGSDSRLAQLFLNLLVNAAQAVGEGRADEHTITVSLSTDARGWAVATVSDDGPGIPAEVASHIFDPFFTTKPVGVGTGLGLSICHGIVEGMGGSITVASGPGRGTTFRVTLPPMTGEAHVSVELSVPAPAASLRGRVLVIDDEPAITRVVKRALAGHDVVVAHSGRAALELLRGDPAFDAVLCDLMMPEVSGMDVYAELMRTNPDLTSRMVFMSGGAFTERAREFIQSVPNDLAEKPFDVQKLRQLVVDVLARASRG
ncbi:MAG: Sensor protein [Myxococcales bacterium]|nr:Sensor protein [Myxococcales bacterium]